MNSIATQTVLPASTARQNLYTLIRSAAAGLRTYEITLRGVKPVVLMSKEELEGWLETLDIMSNPEEVRAIRAARRQKKLYSHQEMLRAIGLDQ